MAPVVVHLDRLVAEDGLGESEQCHVRPSPRPIDGEEAQPGRRQLVEMAVGMRHQFVGAFARGVEGERMVGGVVLRERQARICAVDRAGRRVHEMLDRLLPAAFEHIAKTDEVGVDVGVGIGERISHPGLRGQVHDALGPMTMEQALHVGPVRDRHPFVPVTGATREARQATGDPRRSIAERYASRDDYLVHVRQAAQALTLQQRGGSHHSDTLLRGHVQQPG